MTLLLLLRPRGGTFIFPEPPEDRTYRAGARPQAMPTAARPETIKAPALPEDFQV